MSECISNKKKRYSEITLTLFKADKSIVTIQDVLATNKNILIKVNLNGKIQYVSRNFLQEQLDTLHIISTDLRNELYSLGNLKYKID